MNCRYLFVPAFLMVLTLWVHRASAQERQQCSISYVAASIVYVDAGRDRSLVPGDSLIVTRGVDTLGTLVIVSVSRQSSSAHILSRRAPFVAGDRATWLSHAGSHSAKPTQEQPDTLVLESTPSTPRPEPPTNSIRGLVALQYSQISAQDSRLSLSQPALIGRLSVGNLFGTGTLLSIDSRSTYDASTHYAIDGLRSGVQTRAYEISLRRDDQNGPFGFGLGRLTSPYVSGLGSFDGIEAFFRIDEFTAGVVGGSQVLDRTLAMNQEGTKGAAFINYRHGADIFHRFDGTIAYGRQMVNGQLDREFLYTQNQVSIGPSLSFFQSGSLELQNLVDGKQQSSPVLTSLLLQMNYSSGTWLTADAGYEAVRTIPLYESMKLVPDSLIDRGLFQGMHVDGSIRISSSASFSLNGSYGERPSDLRATSTLGAGIRGLNLLTTRINGSLWLTESTGPYATASDLSMALDSQVSRDWILTLRGSYRSMDVSMLQQSYSTTTGGVDVYYRLTSSMFSTLSFDYIRDATMNSIRFFIEIGYRF